jgi:Flp pilus assembly protein CpaB
MGRLESAVFLTIGAMITLFVAWQYYEAVEPEKYTIIEKLRIKASLDAPIERGEELDSDHLESFTFYLPPGAEKTDFDFVLDNNEAVKTALIGQPFNQTVQPGAMLERRFFFGKTPESFAQRVLPGHRAFSLDVTGSDSLLNFIAPGSAVDILGTVEAADNVVSTELLLENVIIMAIGDADTVEGLGDATGRRSRSITIQATPDKISTYMELQSRTRGDMLVALRGQSADASQ